MLFNIQSCVVANGSISNGDDAIELFKNGSVETFGDINLMEQVTLGVFRFMGLETNAMGDIASQTLFEAYQTIHGLMYL